MDYRSVIESKYNRQNWQALLYDIFRNKVQFWQQPQPVLVDKDMAKNALYTGKITLPDGNVIAIYEVELSDSVIIERNRAGIRNLLLSSWRGMGCSGAFMFCFRQNEAVLRFSYVSESFAFAEDGSLTKERTDTKRFTYLLGEGHRSRTAIMQFEDLKKSALDLKAITKAFSVEALSDLFFKEYKKLYEDIIEYITGKRMVKVANKWEEQVTGQPCREIMQEFSQFSDSEKAVRDYVKKLMGRLVFIQFLQKKGWMGCSAGESWNDGDKEFVQNLFANTAHKNTFVDDVLEPLFNDINTKRTGDISSNPNVGTGIKIPYLNGGLFEKDDYDKTNFQLPAKFMKNLLDFFASYNFTIDENDPDDAEIGVDPEMLGRIFENLLEDNKDKGAFYTPKEIVQYMCRESLIAYLQTDVNDEQTKEAIRQFATTYDVSILSEELKESVDQKLKDVKICDPAIGSGAFPMGMLRELYACRKAIEGIDDEIAVSIKTHIIQNNIYGVDIEKGAVDIARLRFWLALIVDEKNPHALPNMDFKIMQGNSLLEQYEGVELSGMSLDEQNKKKTKKGQSWQATLAFDEKYALDNIQHAIKEYYLTDDHNAKLSLRGIINENIRSYIINLKGCTPDVQKKIEKLPIPNDKFFLWHIYFKEVFDDGGFDIVIGNPPYVGEKGHKEMFRKVQQGNLGQYHQGKMDYFYFFFHLGLNILSNNGIVSFITTNYYVTALGGFKLRKDINDRSSVIKVLNFNEFKIFKSALGQHNMITMLRKGINKNLKCDIVNVQKKGVISPEVFYDIIGKEDKECLYATLSQSEVFETDEYYIRLSQQSEGNFLTQVLSKIANGNEILDNVCKVNVGLRSGIDRIKNKHLESFPDFVLNQGIFVVSESELSTREAIVKPFYKNSDIKKYYTNSQTGMRVIYSTNKTKIEDFSDVYSHLLKFKDVINKYRWEENTKWYALVRPRNEEIFTTEKIVAPQRSLTNTFGYNEIDWYASSDVYYITNPSDGYKLKYILGLLNSKLYYTWLYNKGKRKGEALELYQKPLSEIPIKKASLDEQELIVLYVDKILSAKKVNPLADTTAEEHEIDLLVYKLYGLTEDEIKIVEGTK